jgi:hypothetical protein
LISRSATKMSVKIAIESVPSSLVHAPGRSVF